jgi:ABC-type multidrug transport system ATPase subunit/sugar lactone lactonase YvrE
MSEPLWTLEQVTMTAPVRPRLDGVSVVIPTGRTALIGASGAGKTSLLNLLVGFEKPDAGRIASRIPHSKRLPVFWSPADGGLWPRISKEGHLLAVRSPSQRDSGFATERLAEMDLQGTGTESVDDLSAGERSRLAMARALAADAQVLVLDEPLSHVDPARLFGYWDVIRRRIDAAGTSVVFSSHHPDVILAHAEQAICLDGGRVVWAGPVAELYDQPPSEGLGWMLGPVNWFEPQEAAAWLNENRSAAFGLRPERLILENREDGAGVVQSVTRTASALSVEVHSPAGQKRRLHVSPRSSPAVGAKVALRALVGLLMAVCMHGCTRSDAATVEVPSRMVATWMAPNVEAKLPAPRGLHVAPDGDLLVLDDAGRMMVYGRDHELKHTFWMPEYTVGRPEGLWTLQDGRIAITDTHYHRIVFMRQDGTVESMLGEEGEGPGQFIFPETVIQDPDGHIYVCEYGGNDRIQRFSPDGKFELAISSVGTEPGQVQRPTGLAWYDGLLYVCDAVNNRVQAFTPDGHFERVVADAQTIGLYYPYDMAVSPAGELFVVEFGSGRVTKLSRDGKLLGRIGHAGREDGQFWTPWGVAAAPDGRLFVADTGNRRMVELRLE